MGYLEMKQNFLQISSTKEFAQAVMLGVSAGSREGKLLMHEMRQIGLEIRDEQELNYAIALIAGRLIVG